MKTASIDALKFRLLWATYQYVHGNIKVMNNFSKKVNKGVLPTIY